MRWLEVLGRRSRGLVLRNQQSACLQAELNFHLEALTAEKVAAGMAPEEARQAAMREFGNATLVREQTQETWGWTWLERLAQDVRFAMRQIGRAPGFALIAIATLALGIGANTAVFTLTHALLLSDLPVREPDRLVRLAIDLRSADRTDDTDIPLNLPMIQAMRRRARSFDGVFGWSNYGFRPEHGDARRAILGAAVSGNAFQVLGIRPAAGRLIGPADDQPGGGPDGWAGVISYRDWVQRYHSDPSVVGSHIVVTDHPVTIVGVAPRGFEGMLVGQHPDLYLPLEFDAALNGEKGLHNGGNLWLVTFARLRQGVSREQARAEMNAIFPSLEEEVFPPRLRQDPYFKKAQLAVRNGGSGWSDLQMEYSKPLILLQVLVGAVLLICCANLSGLFLARAAARQQEFAIRAALGAARGRLMRQLLVESLMLAVPGALLGVALAWLAGPWLLHLLGTNHQDKIALSVQPDLAVLCVTAACGVLCALLFGMAPAWVAGHTSVEAALRGTQTRVAAGSSGVRRFFVPFQVALSLVLVVMAALLASTVVRLRTDASGYRTENVYFYITDLNRIPEKGAAAVLPLYRRMIARMDGMPGIVSASAVEIPPLFDMGDGSKFVSADAGPKAQATDSLLNSVGSGFLATVGTPFVAGRDLRNDETDADSCILNQAAAAKFFPKANALGQMLRQAPLERGDPAETPHTCQVVGIVGNAKYYTLFQEFEPIVYLPLSARTRNLTGIYLVIRAQSAAAAEAAQHTALSEMAPTSPESDAMRFVDMFHDSIARQQLLSALTGFFALLGLLLSGIGIYGLVAWNVTQRTREIGVRMALGATRMRVFGLVMRQLAALLALGVAAGGLGAYFAARSIREFLFEVQPGNPVIFALAALALVVVGLVAAMLPARRAVTIDPMQALRTE